MHASTSSVEAIVDQFGECTVVGRLASSFRGKAPSATFKYNDAWLADPHAYPLDPELPLVPGAHRPEPGQSMFRAFFDSDPDRWGHRMIERLNDRKPTKSETPPLTEYDYVVGVRDDLRLGAVRFRTPGSETFLAPSKSQVPHVSQLPRQLDLAAKVENDEADLDDLDEIIHASSGLGGARPKAHAINREGRLCIAKFPRANSDFWNVMAWEKTALELARRAGIKVADSQLLTAAGRDVLLVERFDRAANLSDRIGYVSALTKTQSNDGETGTYLQLAKVIEDASPRATEDLRELWRRIAFTILISNTDDHFRNHGFLHVEGAAWSLSPAFDINPNPKPGPKFLATAISDPDDTRASIDLLLEVANHFRLSELGAVDILREVCSAVEQREEVARAIGLSQREINHMAPAFEHNESLRAAEITGIQRA